jgi:2-hydroxychromene-2-carboxylate isomerase
MTRSIDYYFSLASPWAYLGHDLLMQIAAQHGVQVRFRPIPLRALFPETGGLPLPKRHPVRQHYRLVELQRWRAWRKVDLILQPQHWPFDPALADRMVIAIVQAGGDPDRFIRAGFRAAWHEQRDVGDAATIRAIAMACGVDPGLLDQQGGEEPYAANMQLALAAGVFGAPSYVLDGEIFWGQDRLELLDAALASGRAPYRA